MKEIMTSSHNMIMYTQAYEHTTYSAHIHTSNKFNCRQFSRKEKKIQKL